MTNSISDIADDSQCIFIIGSNTTENHPVIGTKIRQAKRYRGAKLIVADPRRIDISTYADLHLRHRPGTDIALLNGLMHVILREGWQDDEFIRERTEGFEELKAVVEKYTPEVASDITGVPAEDIVLAATHDGRKPTRDLALCHGHHPAHHRRAQCDELRQHPDAFG